MQQVKPRDEIRSANLALISGRQCLEQAQTLARRHDKKRRKYGVFKVDLAGIEPASENSSIQASPITVIILTFPPSPA